MTTIDINKNCKVINNSKYNLRVLDAYNDSDSAGQIIYENTLTSIKTTTGDNIIAKQTTADIELNRIITDPSTGKGTYGTIYELILAQSGTLFPVDNVSEMISFDTFTYPDITVGDENYNRMNLALKFYQTIGAFPSSNLTLTFTQALQASSQSNVTEIDKALDDFFANTKEYKIVTGNDYSTVSSYLEMYPLVWLVGQTTYTYYIYTSGESSNDIKAAPIYQGSLTIEKLSDAEPNDYSGGCKITFSNNNGIDTPLFYDKGQFVDNKETDIPNICLKGSFVLKSNLTLNDEDKEIIPLLIGTINNKQVMGGSVKQDGSSSDSSWYTFWHPQTFQQWLQLFLTIVGVIFAIHFLVNSIINIKNLVTKLIDKARANAGNDSAEPSESDLQEVSGRRNGILQINRAAAQYQYDQFTGCRSGDCREIPEGEEIESEVSSLKTETQTTLANSRYQNLDNLFNEQKATVQELAKYGVSDPIEEATSELLEANQNLKAASSSLENSNLTEANAQLNDVNTSLSKIDTNIDQISQDLSSELSEEMKEQIETVRQVSENVKIYEESASKANEIIEEGGIEEDAEFPEFFE